MSHSIHPEFPDYLIHSDGSVTRRVDSKKYQKAGDAVRGRVIKDSGYRQFKLVHADGKPRLIRANRLVCEAFHGAPPTDKHHAAHKNGKRLDNSETNLYWATVRQNIDDMVRHGTMPHGSKSGMAILDERRAVQIRNRYDGKRGCITRLSEEYGVSLSAIRSVIYGKTWAHVPTVIQTPPSLWDRLDKGQRIAMVRKCRDGGMSVREAAAHIGVGRDTVMHTAINGGVSFPRYQGR